MLILEQSLESYLTPQCPYVGVLVFKPNDDKGSVIYLQVTVVCDQDGNVQIVVFP